MLFNSLGYFAFLLLAIPIAWVLPARARVVMLGAFSVLFYAMWRWEFSLLIVFSAAVDFVCAQKIHATDIVRKRRGWLLTSLIVNLGLLAPVAHFAFGLDS